MEHEARPDDEKTEDQLPKRPAHPTWPQVSGDTEEAGEEDDPAPLFI